MSDDNRKQLAPTVVLASHGNKNACRELYLNYHKRIYFICSGMTGDVKTATELTAQAFIKMFGTLGKLDDHNSFEQWFFSLTINMCRKHMAENNGDITDADIRKNALAAAHQAKKHDMAAFERSVMRILERMIFCMPAGARVLFFYKNFALLDCQQIAALEKTEPEEIEKQLSALDILTDKQCEKIRTMGVDITMFTKDMNETLLHIASKKFIPDSVHNAVSESLGVDVSPFAPEKTKKTEPVAEKKIPEKQEEEPAKKKKSGLRLTKGDIILFFGIIAAVLIIFGVASHFIVNKDNKNSPTVSQSSSEKPALLWNGAAASSFDGGSGTESDPFRIATGGQLAYLANLVNSGSSYYAACSYILTADIILNETELYDIWYYKAPENEWTPIGMEKEDDSHAYFTGSFDGNGCTISGMYISGGNDYSGLFGVTRNASFKDITIVDSYISGGSYTGGIAGYFAADTKEESGFSDCSFSGYIYSSGNNAGGITGYFRAEGEGNTTFMTKCCVSGLIYAENGYAGGLTGAAEADTGSVMIKNCFNAATVTAGKNAGGITGDSRAADGIAIIDCCYNSGRITATENSGGISGIINCASGEGKVNIQSCFMLDTSAVMGLTRGTGGERLVVGSIAVLSDSEMLLADNFDPFDFENVWKIPAEGNYRYPVLSGTPLNHATIEFNEEGST